MKLIGSDRSPLRHSAAATKSIERSVAKGSVRSVLILAVIGAFGCGHVDRPARPPELEPVGNLLRLQDSVTLADTGATGVIRLSGAALLGDSLLVISDPSNIRIVLVDLKRGGVRPFGRAGDGPGEFRLPVAPKLDAYGRVHLLDPVQRKIHIFDPVTGEFVRSVNLAGGPGGLFDFAVLADGRYALSGTFSDGVTRGVVVVDSLGGASSQVAIPVHPKPDGAADSPLWAVLSRLNLATRGDSFWVTQPLLDTVWVTTSGKGEVGRLGIPTPGYLVPQLPKEEFTERSQIAAWWRAMLLPHKVIRTDARLYVGFSRGVYNDGAPGVLMVQTPDGSWHAAADAPPIIGASGDRVIAVLSGDSLPIRIGIFAEVAR